jgi:hypothetical protein
VTAYLERKSKIVWKVSLKNLIQLKGYIVEIILAGYLFYDVLEQLSLAFDADYSYSIDIYYLCLEDR